MIKFLTETTVKFGLKCLPYVNKIDCIIHKFLSKNYNTDLCKTINEEKIFSVINNNDMDNILSINNTNNNSNRFLINGWKILSLLIIIFYIILHILSISFISIKKKFPKEIKSELSHIVHNDEKEEETKFIEERTYNKFKPLRTSPISPIRSSVSLNDLNNFISELRSTGFKVQQVNDNEIKSKVMKLDKNGQLYLSWRKSFTIPCTNIVSAIEGDGIPPSFILEVENMNPLYFRVDSINKATQMVKQSLYLIFNHTYKSIFLLGKRI
jgi:predicted RNA-binding protein with RPS1 domain